MAHKPPAQYGSSSADLVYALNEGGRVVHISEVPSGAACRCRCPSPACGRPLVAKTRQLKANQYGRFKVKHFAHNNGSSCKNAPETAVHLFGKQVVEGHLRLLLPEITATYEGRSRVLWKGGEVTFNRATKEFRDLEQVVPDLLVERDGHFLLVEVVVTHRCDDAKIAALTNPRVQTSHYG